MKWRDSQQKRRSRGYITVTARRTFVTNDWASSAQRPRRVILIETKEAVLEGDGWKFREESPVGVIPILTILTRLLVKSNLLNPIKITLVQIYSGCGIDFLPHGQLSREQLKRNFKFDNRSIFSFVYRFMLTEKEIEQFSKKLGYFFL